MVFVNTHNLGLPHVKFMVLSMLTKQKKEAGRRHRQQGFSLMELLIVIAIAGIIAAIAIPGLLGTRARYQLRASATDVLATFKKAQSEAVKRNTSVTVTIGPTACTVSDSAGTLFITTTQSGNTVTNSTFSTSPVFTSGGIMTNTCQTGAPPLPCNSVDVISGGGIAVRYRLAFSTIGHVTLLTSTNGGTTFN